MEEINAYEIEEKFGFYRYTGMEEIPGWLLNYQVNKYTESMWTSLYFVKEDGSSFKISTRFYCSFLLETTDNHSVTEMLLKRYEKVVYKIEEREKINLKNYNHLNLPKTKYLKVFCMHETGMNELLKDIKDMLFEKRKHNSETFRTEEHNTEVLTCITGHYESDILFDTQAANNMNIRCGLWYKVRYDGDQYVIIPEPDNMSYPRLRIFAFDIETFKSPLMFPKAEVDEIMMISMRTEAAGFLIINRMYCGQEISGFTYSPKPEMATDFVVFNEENEEGVLIKFIELIQQIRPHITTTFNGAFFDYEFIEKRLCKLDLSLEVLTGIRKVGDYYNAAHMVHLDCYLWVKRDSYLPASSQGLKAATRAKLKYEPDEIDPEEMVRCAMEEPQKMASYSVSDAVATYFLYMKFVHSHIFSLCSLIPLPPDKVLTRGSGMLCEALLISQAELFDVLIPSVQKTEKLAFHNGRVVDNLTYVGGHVESLKAGVFRADFLHTFKFDSGIIELIKNNLDDLLEDYKQEPEYGDVKKQLISNLSDCKGEILEEGAIYHLDVGAMYPNIILTNKLQPVSIVNEEACIRCDYNDESNRCKRRMNWVSRAEYYPPTAMEVTNIVEQLNKEAFYVYENTKNKKVERKVPFSELPIRRQTAILKQRLDQYSKTIYKRSKCKEEVMQGSVVCQREVPFYVDTVKLFRNQRYKYKAEHKAACKVADEKPTKENRDKSSILNSLQIAYKCILNSFYGYVMNKGSRWWSIDMAAITCRVGGQIIIKAKSFINGIGIPLELDTDGIWAVIPNKFPSTIKIGNRTVSLLNEALNYFVCKMFTNDQYQELIDNEYGTRRENSIFFEIDGPYKTMVIPASVEENRLLKKRYIVFDFNNNIAELKGFELKRRGELKFIKKFQEDLIQKYCLGSTLKECYNGLADVAKYWLNIIDTNGANLDDKSLFELFCESKSMSKDVGDYCTKKSNILSTAKKLAEMLGDDVLKEKLKCEFIVTKYPESDSTADRVIPVIVFKSAEKEYYLEKWIGKKKSYEVRDLIDWVYYRKRYTMILQRMIIVPGYFQGIRGLFKNIECLKWMGEKKHDYFGTEKDIEDIKIDTTMFYTKNSSIVEQVESEEEMVVEESEHKKPKTSTNPRDYKKISKYIKAMMSTWTEFYIKRSKSTKRAYRIEDDGTNITFHNDVGITTTQEHRHRLILEVNALKYFDHLPRKQFHMMSGCCKECVVMEVNTKELREYTEDYFFDHFSIKNTYNNIDPILQCIVDNNFDLGIFEYFTITSTIYQQQPTFFVTDGKGEFKTYAKNNFMAGVGSIKMFLKDNIKKYRAAFTNPNDNKAIELIQNSREYIPFMTDNKTPNMLGTLSNLETIHRNLHQKMKDSAEIVLALNQLTGIPIQNIDKNIVLDTFFYKTMMNNNILIKPNTNKEMQQPFRSELIRPGYYDRFTIQIEISGSVLFAIIEYDAFLKNKNFEGVNTKEFQELRNFIKNLVLKSAEKHKGAMFLLNKVSKWLKTESIYVSRELRETVEILHQQYLVNLSQKLKEKQIETFCLTKEILFVNTNKINQEQTNKFIAFLCKEINQIEGYEMANIEVVRVFDKIGFVSPELYVYERSGIHYLSVEGYTLPESILSMYFSSKQIDNYSIYDIITSMNAESAKLLLRILSYKRDTHGLVSNCYKLLKISEFNQAKPIQLNLSIFCQKCDSECYLREHCTKCLSKFDRNLVEEECLKYLEYCWYQQVEGDKYCTRCDKIEERRLKEYCNCGGKFEFKNYMDEMIRLNSFVRTKNFNKKFEEIVGFFN
ncbi:DNA polymerase [Enterospora canceri]|uniref:DNA polymerase epsilon catalytic subunit n=1 Tax=Enterospora canceri TaxID=1081671 RepID=A0A1Y1S9D8_9MICR|nr:DNA polymerase [Enterospora canceri]